VEPLALGHALGDVGRLLFDGRHHGARFEVEAHLGARVADVFDRLAHDDRHVDRSRRRDLAGDHHDARLGERLAGDAGAWVLRENGVEHGVGYLVAKLVGMAFGDGLRRELITAHLAPTLWSSSTDPRVSGRTL
jgi:hypothetical protein